MTRASQIKRFGCRFFLGGAFCFGVVGVIWGVVVVLCGVWCVVMEREKVERGIIAYAYNVMSLCKGE